MPRPLYWYEMPRPDPRRPVGLAPVCAATARMIVESQLSLDAGFLAEIDGWDETGIPPIGRVWSSCRVALGVASAPDAKRHAEERTRLAVAPRHKGAGTLVFSLGYLHGTWGMEK